MNGTRATNVKDCTSKRASSTAQERSDLHAAPKKPLLPKLKVNFKFSNLTLSSETTVKFSL
jgi:hypothetical protein